MPESDGAFVDIMRTLVYARATESLRTVDGDISPALFHAALRDAFVDVLFELMIGTDGPSAWTTAELERAHVEWAENVRDHERKYPGADWFSYILWELELQRQATIKANGGDFDPDWWLKLLGKLDRKVRS